MRFKDTVGNLLRIGLKAKQVQSSLKTIDKLQVLAEVASLVPHPAVKVLSRTATTGFLLYKQYQRSKIKQPGS